MLRPPMSFPGFKYGWAMRSPLTRPGRIPLAIARRNQPGCLLALRASDRRYRDVRDHRSALGAVARLVQALEGDRSGWTSRLKLPGFGLVDTAPGVFMMGGVPLVRRRLPRGAQLHLLDFRRARRISRQEKPDHVVATRRRRNRVVGDATASRGSVQIDAAKLFGGKR